MLRYGSNQNQFEFDCYCSRADCKEKILSKYGPQIVAELKRMKLLKDFGKTTDAEIADFFCPISICEIEILLKNL